MGTLTDNLLKLTEFPFSYSFIGLLALIFGEGLNLDEPSLGELGPLLILMGFIATTLSITDPIGRFQALILLRSNFENKLSAMFPFSSPTLTLGGAREIWQVKIFGLGIMQSIPSTIVLIAASSNFRSWLKHYSKSKDAILDKLSEQLERARVEELSNIPLLGVKTLSTAWIVREIDKINAMVYFMIVVLTFLSAFTLDQFIHFGFTEKVLGSFHNSAGARISIIIFTIIGLTAVWNMIRRHFEVLRFNAFKTFRYLIVKEAYVKLRVELKIETETIEKGLLQVEQYLNNGEWTLADFALDQVIQEFDFWLIETLRTLDKAKAEKNMKINYQDLGIYQPTSRIVRTEDLRTNISSTLDRAEKELTLNDNSTGSRTLYESAKVDVVACQPEIPERVTHGSYTTGGSDSSIDTGLSSEDFPIVLTSPDMTSATQVFQPSIVQFILMPLLALISAGVFGFLWYSNSKRPSTERPSG